MEISLLRLGTAWNAAEDVACGAHYLTNNFRIVGDTPRTGFRSEGRGDRGGTSRLGTAWKYRKAEAVRLILGKWSSMAALSALCMVALPVAEGQNIPASASCGKAKVNMSNPLYLTTQAGIFAVELPQGWVLDKTKSNPFFLIKAGETYENARTLMYINVQRLDVTFSDAVKRDEQTFRESCREARIQDAPKLEILELGCENKTQTFFCDRKTGAYVDLATKISLSGLLVNVVLSGDTEVGDQARYKKDYEFVLKHLALVGGEYEANESRKPRRNPIYSLPAELLADCRRGQKPCLGKTPSSSAHFGQIRISTVARNSGSRRRIRDPVGRLLLRIPRQLERLEEVMHVLFAPLLGPGKRRHQHVQVRPRQNQPPIQNPAPRIARHKLSAHMSIDFSVRFAHQAQFASAPAPRPVPYPASFPDPRRPPAPPEDYPPMPRRRWSRGPPQPRSSAPAPRPRPRYTPESRSRSPPPPASAP